MAPLPGQIPFSSAFPKMNVFHSGKQSWVFEWENYFSWPLVLCSLLLSSPSRWKSGGKSCFLAEKGQP